MKRLATILLAFLIASCLFASDPSATNNEMFSTLEVNAPDNNKDGIPDTAEIFKVPVVFMQVDKNEIRTLANDLPNIEKELAGEVEIDAGIPSGIIDLKPQKYSTNKADSIKKMPVLNQARTNTCGTFASTAATEMLLFGGNHQFSITQSLQLGSSLSQTNKLLQPISKEVFAYNRKRFINPWDPTYPGLVLTQFDCYGMAEPADKNDRDGTFSEKNKTIKLKNTGNFTRFNFYKKQLFWAGKGESPANHINNIEKAIDKGSFVVINVLIFYSYGNDGMSAKLYPRKLGNKIISSYPDISGTSGVYNVWFYRPELARILKEADSLPPEQSDKICGGHIMTIIGYQKLLKQTK